MKSGRGKKKSKKQPKNKDSNKEGGKLPDGRVPDRYGTPVWGPLEQEVDQPPRPEVPRWDRVDPDVEVYEPAPRVKRPRAQYFDTYQVQNMKDLANMIGWTLQDPRCHGIVDIFCSSFGISHQEFQIWMNVNKNRFGPGSSGAGGSSIPPPAPAN